MYSFPNLLEVGLFKSSRCKMQVEQWNWSRRIGYISIIKCRHEIIYVTKLCTMSIRYIFVIKYERFLETYSI
jgi:hypothetical protein